MDGTEPTGMKKPPLRMCVAETVRGRREAVGLSIKALALRTGLSRGTLHQLESGRAHVSTWTLERVCRAFGISMTELFAEAERRRHH